MTDPILTTGVALVGAGTWFANKVFGPSADALGESMRVFLSDRVSKVFAKAEQLATEPETLHQLPPGFLLKYVQSASFSEDDDLITELWANLLINASKDFTQRKMLYLAILEQLSADDAQILDQLFSSFVGDLTSYSLNSQKDGIRTRGLFAAERILQNRGLSHFDWNAANEFNDEMEKNDSQFSVWPVVILGSMVPHTPLIVEGAVSPVSSSSCLANSNVQYDALIRQRLIQTFEVSFISGFTIELEGVMATALGVEFIRNCRGIVQ